MIWLLATLQFALPSDSSALRRAAERELVPPAVMYAIAWQETRSGQRLNDYIGPGREQCDSIPPGRCRRVCREIGRMQINPCGRWASLAQCSLARIKFYHGNLRCAAVILRKSRDIIAARDGVDVWTGAMKMYNGSGPHAEAYLTKALAYLGWLHLHGP